MDPFNIYLQTLLSQALDSDFLEALLQENGMTRPDVFFCVVHQWECVAPKADISLWSERF